MRKFLIFPLCVILLLAFAACKNEPAEQLQPTYEEQKAYYADIVTRYSELLDAKSRGEALIAPVTEGTEEREADIASVLYGIVETWGDGEKTEVLGYGYKDFDGDGTPELLLSAVYTRIFAIFTLKENVPVLLLSEYGTEGFIELVSENKFLMQRATQKGTVDEITYYTFRIEGDHIAYDAVCAKAYDRANAPYDASLLERYEIKDGKKTPIDEDSFRVLYLEHQRRNEGIVPNHEGKLAAPRTYFPTKQAVADTDLPLVDFSDYAAIRRTYQAIASCVDDFDATRWLWGEYDNLFSFPSDDAFSYYTRLLYAAHRGGGNAGYDEQDLNGDGADELVLLGEDFRIKAIFTQENGIPVLLDAFAWETCWLDDKGFFHVDREDYYEIEYSLYEFTQGGEYHPVYAILVDQWGNHYLTKDGKTEKIDFDTSRDLYYDEYCRYSEPFSPNEQTRNISSLTYTPLEEKDFVNSSLQSKWYKYATLEKTTGKYMACANIYVTLERVADTEVTVDIQYVFSYCYPDPDRDHTMLEDRTESSLVFTARLCDGRFVFDGQGLRGSLELREDFLWIILEESTDSRFPVGHHCFEIDKRVR